MTVLRVHHLARPFLQINGCSLSGLQEGILVLLIVSIKLLKKRQYDLRRVPSALAAPQTS